MSCTGSGNFDTMPDKNAGHGYEPWDPDGLFASGSSQGSDEYDEEAALKRKEYEDDLRLRETVGAWKDGVTQQGMHVEEGSAAETSGVDDRGSEVSAHLYLPSGANSNIDSVNEREDDRAPSTCPSLPSPSVQKLSDFSDEDLVVKLQWSFMIPPVELYDPQSKTSVSLESIFKSGVPKGVGVRSHLERLAKIIDEQKLTYKLIDASSGTADDLRSKDMACQSSLTIKTTIAEEFKSRQDLCKSLQNIVQDREGGKKSHGSLRTTTNRLITGHKSVVEILKDDNLHKAFSDPEALYDKLTSMPESGMIDAAYQSDKDMQALMKVDFQSSEGLGTAPDQYKWAMFGRACDPLQRTTDFEATSERVRERLEATEKSAVGPYWKTCEEADSEDETRSQG